LFTSHPSSTDKEGEDYTFVGRVDLNKLDSEDLFLDDKTTEYYICGPEKFMTDMESSLKAKGVPAARIKMELFGTGGVTH
jgi:nitric oxide dioxygenase